MKIPAATSKLLSEYVKLESEFKALEMMKTGLRGKILEAFEKNDLDKVEDPTLGSFTVGKKKSWTYSPAVKTLEERLKIAKNKEQEKGIAEATESSYLVYNRPKDNATD